MSKPFSALKDLLHSISGTEKVDDPNVMPSPQTLAASRIKEQPARGLWGTIAQLARIRGQNRLATLAVAKEEQDRQRMITESEDKLLTSKSNRDYNTAQMDNLKSDNLRLDDEAATKSGLDRLALEENQPATFSSPTSPTEISPRRLPPDIANKVGPAPFEPMEIQRSLPPKVDIPFGKAGTSSITPRSQQEGDARTLSLADMVEKIKARNSLHNFPSTSGVMRGTGEVIREPQSDEDGQKWIRQQGRSNGQLIWGYQREGDVGGWIGDNKQPIPDFQPVGPTEYFFQQGGAAGQQLGFIAPSTGRVVEGDPNARKQPITEGLKNRRAAIISAEHLLDQVEILSQAIHTIDSAEGFFSGMKARVSGAARTVMANLGMDDPVAAMWYLKSQLANVSRYNGETGVQTDMDIERAAGSIPIDPKLTTTEAGNKITMSRIAIAQSKQATATAGGYKTWNEFNNSFVVR